MDRLIHTPEGVRDVYNQECTKKLYLENQIEQVFHAFGYQDIETPTFEFFDVFGREVGTTPSRELYKFFDRDGNTLVLRPDFTPSIARAASMYFMEETMPIRLCYRGSSFVNSSSYQGRLKESTQMGVELLNDDSAMADAEIIAMTVKVMLDAGLTDFQISIGHVGFFQALSEEAALAEDVLNELKELISIKNHFGAEELLAKQNLRSDLFEALRDVPQLFGNAEILEKAKGLTRNPAAREALDRLATIYEIVKDYGYEKYVFFDLGLLSKFHYYTGIIFQAYTYGTGEPIVKGGRYDALLQHFGKKAPAIGFCTVMESLMNALERQKISLPIVNTKTMLLYPDFLQPLAVKLANEHRSKGMDVALICFARDKVLADYEEYGRKNQFGGIVYIQKSDSVLAIDLSTGEVQPVEL